MQHFLKSFEDIYVLKSFKSQASGAHAFNPSYSAGRNQED
jgi:hypothetical protein